MSLVPPGGRLLFMKEAEVDLSLGCRQSTLRNLYNFVLKGLRIIGEKSVNQELNPPDEEIEPSTPK